jgi:hypothetical protein
MSGEGWECEHGHVHGWDETSCNPDDYNTHPLWPFEASITAILVMGVAFFCGFVIGRL